MLPVILLRIRRLKACCLAPVPYSYERPPLNLFRMLGKLNPEQMDYVLRSQLIGRIGCYAEGRVYLVPITYVYDGEYIYGHTREGLKVRMMRQNPEICFEVDAIKDMANWQCVIIQGVYEELNDEESQVARRLL